MRRGKGGYDTVLRCRAPRSLKVRMEAILERRGHGDLSELIREALLRYVETEEARLGISGNPHFYTVGAAQERALVAEEPPLSSGSKPSANP
ncbi:MAG TPA: hypothetical protein VNQ90_12930 [Chthoniobacteraceae bacterium]|nr:hypothetical protein [Chthoniobacteraceae bacterium]